MNNIPAPTSATTATTPTTANTTALVELGAEEALVMRLYVTVFETPEPFTDIEPDETEELYPVTLPSVYV